ncbi:MAG: hypothetical protein ACLT8E_03975 [Akkermansia sp.]
MRPGEPVPAWAFPAGAGEGKRPAGSQQGAKRSCSATHPTGQARVAATWRKPGTIGGVYPTVLKLTVWPPERA